MTARSRNRSATADAWSPSTRHRDAVVRVARAFGVGDFALFGRGRKREVANARKVAYLVLRDSFGLTYTQTAKLFGNRDHSTIIYGIASASAMARRSPELAALIERLKALGPAVPHNAHVLAWLDHNYQRHKARDQRAQRRAIKDAPMVEASVELRPKRISKPVNTLDPDDHDARARAVGTGALSAAIAAAGGWPTQRSGVAK